MSFNRNEYKKQYKEPTGFPYVNLRDHGSTITGFYIGDELQTKRNFSNGRYTTPQIASDGKVATATILHILVTGGSGYASSVEDGLVGQHVKYEVKGGYESLKLWRETAREADVIPGDTVTITRTGSDPRRNNAGVFSYNIVEATDYPPNEVTDAYDELRAARKSRNELDAEAKQELAEAQQASTFHTDQSGYAQGVGYSNNSIASYGAPRGSGYDTVGQPF